MSHSRRSKYKPKYCAMLIKSAESGESISKFCADIGISMPTFYEWTKVHEDFDHAHEIAVAKAVAFWEQLGINLMIGRPLDPGSKSKGDRHVWMFFMRNRFRSAGYGDDDAFSYEKNDGFDV